MKKRVLTCAVLAAMVFAACSKEEGAATSGPRSVVIDPTLLEMSKTTRATDVDFETGDAIGLTITMADGGAVYADNARFSYAGGKFVSDAGLLWYEDIGLKSNLVAYYPYAETAPTEFTVKSDQSGDNYTLSDLMIAAKSDVTPTLDATDMTFRHRLTKLVVNVNNQSGGEIAAVQVRNTVPTAAVDLATQTVAVKEGAAVADITAAEKIAGKQYFAIVVPQTVAPQLAVTIRMSGEEKTLTQTYKELDMLSGQYTIAVNVLADKIDVTVTGDIEDWDDNGSWEVDDQVPFEEFEDYFLYDGERYAIVSLADGNKWMAENLRYVPAGKRVSSDPTDDADGIWYPAANADKTADPSLVATLGLLYDAGAAFGAEVTDENAYSFEGKQGICPKGWHIPTNAELTGLVGQNANGALTDTSAPYYDATIKGASIATLNEAGFNWTFAGARNKASLTGTGSYLVTNYGGVYGVMTYVLGSTCYLVKVTNEVVTNMQYYSLMSTYNASNEKVTVAYGNVKSGYSVRCVKNK